MNFIISLQGKKQLSAGNTQNRHKPIQQTSHTIYEVIRTKRKARGVQENTQDDATQNTAKYRKHSANVPQTFRTATPQKFPMSVSLSPIGRLLSERRQNRSHTLALKTTNDDLHHCNVCRLLSIV